MKILSKVRKSFILFVPFFILWYPDYGFSQNEFKRSFIFGISSEIFEEINIRDAKVSLKLWVKLMTNEMPGIDNLDIIIYDNVESIIKDSKENKIDIMFISSLMYAKYEDKINLLPVITTKINHNDFYHLNLLTNKNQPELNFSDLKNSTIHIQGGKYKKVAELWLDFLALKNGIKEKYSYFKKIEFTEKPMQAILPTFMGKADYCIVNSVSFEAIAELNPQVTKNLKSVFISNDLSNDLICVSKLLNEEEKGLVLDISQNFSELPKKEQISKIFKSSGAGKFKKSDLDGVRLLINKYNKLITRSNN